MKERIRLANNNSSFDYVIDARMGLEQMELYICKNNDEWRKTLTSPDRVDRDPCTARSIVYNTSVIGGIIGSLVKKLIKKEKVPEKIIFDLKTYMIVV